MTEHQMYPAGDDGEPMVSAERAFLNDVRLVLAVLNWARYPVMCRVFGISRDQVNIVTFVLAVTVADATYETLRRFIRHPWPLDGFDTAAAAFVMRDAGFGIAGPNLRATHQFGTLVAIAAI